MSDLVTIKDNHLHITYSYYDYGNQVGRKIIPLEDIECIKATVGKQGGMHTWSLRGYSPEYSKNKNDRDIQIHSGDRKNTELIDMILALLPNCEYKETIEGGGAPW